MPGYGRFMPAREMPAAFVYTDGREEQGTVELDADELPPYSVERDEVRFRLERVSRPGVAVYVER